MLSTLRALCEAAGVGPSRRHQLLARAVPRLRGSRDLDSVAAERSRLERWHAGLDRSLPTGVASGLERRHRVVREHVDGPGGGFDSWVVSPHGARPTTTVYYLHGGGFVAPIDARHVRYAVRLARPARARVVLPDYPLAPEHSWRDSHQALADDVVRYAARGPVVLAGDSAGGNLALSLAATLRDRGGSVPHRLLLLSPWVDLSESTPATADLDGYDPWLHLAKLRTYAAWWAGYDDPADPGLAAELRRPELSPALGDLAGLAARAHVLRHPRPAPPGVSAAGRPGRGRRLAADLRRAARADPRLPAAARRPRGAPGRPPGSGVPVVSAGVRVEVRGFDELDATTAYAVWRLRQEVFVVEQECAYPDLDGRDPEPGTRHVLLHEEPAGALLGYLRVLDDGDHARIGRVVLRRVARGRGLADDLVRAALVETAGRDVVLDAQSPLAGWYAAHGFAVTGPEFLEDGIPHLPMRRTAG